MGLTYHLQISPVNNIMLGVYTMTEFQDGTVITMEVVGWQAHAIGNGIRSLFPDPVTYHSFTQDSDKCSIKKKITYKKVTLWLIHKCILV